MPQNVVVSVKIIENVKGLLAHCGGSAAWSKFFILYYILLVLFSYK